ncbi:Oxidoreductase NAD-binding domain-containing protein 1 [Cytospora mali]|uniref:Oxidoreductase NAD-binding domain-containing protein 1 n=1 Tax=Cytospora mali TaxID=578113 RepID=A0A194UYI8_CYTMA|nr:Oxidoreductase NAD-binding domain-containing protein 1 [Valsa mali var. pyri (nom. inval.)]
MGKTDHAERTVDQPRDNSLHSVGLKKIDEIGQSVRLFRLEIPPTVGSIRWLDVFVPGIDRPGGFTITSPPSKAQKPAGGGDPTPAPYLELAVKKSPDNIVAQWLWKPADEILDSELRVRVGGSFVWPPPGDLSVTLRRLVFVAGGVGINPLMSMVSHLAERADPRYTIDFLYSVRDPGDGNRNASDVLFLQRLANIFNGGNIKGKLRLFLTPSGGSGHGDGSGDAEGSDDEKVMGLDLTYKRRRITTDDIASVIGKDKNLAVVYICGPPTMTDGFVERLTSTKGLGMENHRVLYEKWW